jgi:murein DD-endopeptidase MepM/ murein hydrolase activator NlpD
MSSTAQQAKTFQFKKWKKGFDTQPSLSTAVGAQVNHAAFNTSSFPVMKKPYHATGWQQSGVERSKTSLPTSVLSTNTTPVATILTLASKQPAISTASNTVPMPPVETATPNNLYFLQQLDETLNKINRKNRPSAKRKSMVLVMMGLLLSGGLVAGAMNISVSEHALTGTNNKMPKAKTSNKKPLVGLTAQAEPLADMFDEPTTYQTKATQVAYVPPVSTTQLAEPPSSAVDDTLNFETNASTVQQEHSVKTASKPTQAAHLVDLFEDSAPVPSLSLPEQKKRESLEEALASPPVIPVYQQPSNTNKHWWNSSIKSVFNFRRPLMHLTVSSHFGHRWGRMHRGVDFSAPYGVAIYAANAGTVVYSGWEQGYGKLVIIDHGNGVRTKYAHCSKLNVSVGDWIEKGERIARVGSTGHSTGPHLHFEVVVNGQTRNPLNYLTT